MEFDNNIGMQPSYSYVTKSFHCYTCDRNFRQMVPSGEGATCPACKGEFVEEVTRATEIEIQHFSPFVVNREREEQRRPAQQERSQQRRPQTYTVITQTINPNGTVITTRIISDSPNSSGIDEIQGMTGTSNHSSTRRRNRAVPMMGLGSLFGFPFEGFFEAPVISLNDIIEMSMRDAGRQGAPPASDEAIASLKEVEIKEGEEHQCSICMENIAKNAVKLP